MFYDAEKNNEIEFFSEASRLITSDEHIVSRLLSFHPVVVLLSSYATCMLVQWVLHKLSIVVSERIGKYGCVKHNLFTPYLYISIVLGLYYEKQQRLCVS